VQAQQLKAEVNLVRKGLVRITVTDGAHIEEEDVRMINAAKLALVGDDLHSVLLVSGEDSTASREARELSASEELCRNKKAEAIVIRSVAHKIIGDFFIRVNRPPVPVKLFVCEEKALAWLNEFT
jgi:hypothetical protein